MWFDECFEHFPKGRGGIALFKDWYRQIAKAHAKEHFIYKVLNKLKDDVHSVLRISSAHNKGGPPDNYKHCPNFAVSNFFELKRTVYIHLQEKRTRKELDIQLVSGAVGPMGFFFGGGGARAVLFRQTENVFRQTKNFSDKPKIFPDDNILNLPPPPSTTLTISGNIDNFPTGLNNRGAMAPPATAPLQLVCHILQI
jgi:hypothetical protein